MKTVLRIFAMAGFFSFTVLVLAQGQAQGYGMGMGMGPGMMGWRCGMGWPWAVMMLIFCIAIIVGVVFFVRWLALLANKGRGTASEESSLDILKKRYARGEISKDEYEKIKKDIS